MHPLGKNFIIDNRSDTTIHSAPLKYCHTCKKNTDVGENPPYLDILLGTDESDNVDWVHLAGTIDTWGNRGTTWVTPEGNQIPQFVPLNMIRVVSAHSENTRTEILTDEETSGIFKDCDSCDLMVESTIETSLNSELDEEVNTGSSSTPSDNLTLIEEDPSEDHSTDFALGITHNYKSDKKRKKYKRRRYRANVRAKMNKKQSTADWLCYLGALDAHRKLVDNWGEHLQSVMWCSPQLHDIAQLEIAEKPKLRRRRLADLTYSTDDPRLPTVDEDKPPRVLPAANQTTLACPCCAPCPWHGGGVSPGRRRGQSANRGSEHKPYMAAKLDGLQPNISCRLASFPIALHRRHLRARRSMVLHNKASRRLADLTYPTDDPRLPTVDEGKPPRALPAANQTTSACLCCAPCPWHGGGVSPRRRRGLSANRGSDHKPYMAAEPDGCERLDTRA
ncbi:hypothetical protein L7F22_040437 [Adiantum nelumboides]|nr:hypothetical protein [Adiantum nelumboides]